ncbi:hypothetical protein [Streptomyces sp. AS58]|uniref:hypothetical protein n=1 Tax=Streptomyces sp. AS58 TaxID=1519489 RepID=UPI00131DF9BB|nr:hypothetical protein [Streptomyces sp. AS58]
MLVAANSGKRIFATHPTGDSSLSGKCTSISPPVDGAHLIRLVLGTQLTTIVDHQ